MIKLQPGIDLPPRFRRVWDFLNTEFDRLGIDVALNRRCANGEGQFVLEFTDRGCRDRYLTYMRESLFGDVFGVGDNPRDMWGQDTTPAIFRSLTAAYELWDFLEILRMAESILIVGPRKEDAPCQP